MSWLRRTQADQMHDAGPTVIPPQYSMDPQRRPGDRARDILAASRTRRTGCSPTAATMPSSTSGSPASSTRTGARREAGAAAGWRTGAEIVSTAPSEANLRDDPDDPTRKLVRRLLGALGEWEREMITLRMRAGRRRKAERGGYAYGSPPYGYRAEDGALVRVECE